MHAAFSHGGVTSKRDLGGLQRMVMAMLLSDTRARAVTTALHSGAPSPIFHPSRAHPAEG